MMTLVPWCYSIYQKALAANATLADTSLGKAVTSKCGADFGCESSHTPHSTRSVLISSLTLLISRFNPLGRVRIFGICYLLCSGVYRLGRFRWFARRRLLLVPCRRRRSWCGGNARGHQHRVALDPPFSVLTTNTTLCNTNASPTRHDASSVETVDTLPSVSQSHAPFDIVRFAPSRPLRNKNHGHSPQGRDAVRW